MVCIYISISYSHTLLTSIKTEVPQLKFFFFLQCVRYPAIRDKERSKEYA